MLVINRYLDEISKREFKTEKEAIASEIKNGGIKKLFSFWKAEPKDDTCSFANGGWAYQRKESDYVLLREAILKGIKEYEPWIAKQYAEHGGLKIDHIKGGGRRHTQQIKGLGSHLYLWLYHKNYPSGFQVLCANCNQGKRDGGICPHQVNKH